MNELIISIYDGCCATCVAFNGEIINISDKDQYTIAFYNWSNNKKVKEFCKKYNIQRLIVCEDGDIIIKQFKEE